MLSTHRSLLLGALVVAALCFVAASAPASSLAAANAAALEKVGEAMAHPFAAHPSLHGAPASHDEAGSLHAATMDALERHEAAMAGRHPISEKNQAKADAFVAHLDQLIAGLKAKSHIAQLNRKYPVDAAAVRQQETQAEQAMDAIEAARSHSDAPATAEPPAMHGPAGSEEAQRAHARNSRASRNTRAHIPPPGPARVSTVRIRGDDSSHHVVLDPVPERKRRPRRRLTDDEYVLYSIQLPPTNPSPSGLNFTTFVYPTIQGNVTIFVGVTEYPLGKFHIYPSPRDEIDEFSLIAHQHAQAQYEAQQARARTSRNPRRPHIVSAFLEIQATLNPLCDGVAMTSVSAQAYGCILAQNAGFFNMATNGCMGNVVSNDQFINHATPDLVGHSHFGLTRKGNYITGYMTEEEVAEGVDGGFHELIQGSGWLVRQGRNYINESAAREHIGAGFVTEKAPRNAIGHDSDGRLLMFEADGEEDINLGLTLHEFADILTHHFNVENAINVDGGGSSTTVYKGEVADKPTCRDTPQICERAVTTISCVMP